MTKAAIPPRKLYPVAEARQLLGGIGKTFFYDLVNQRELELIKLGRRSYVSAGSIDALIERSRRASACRK